MEVAPLLDGTIFLSLEVLNGAGHELTNSSGPESWEDPMATVCHEDEHVEEMLKRREKDRTIEIIVLFQLVI